MAQVTHEGRNELDQTTVEFWQNHSVRFRQMVFSTDKRGRMDNADGYGNADRECGDSLEIFLRVDDGVIRSAYFDTDGCIYTVACGNAVANLIEGMTVKEAAAIAPADIAKFLETLPENETHCAVLAVVTLQLALEDCRENDRQPWKKFYRRK